MAATESQMLELGTEAPDFSLPDAEGAVHSLAESASAYLVMFICNHCPFVKHVREELARLGQDYSDRSVAIYAINSNDSKTYSGDSPAMMKQESATWGYTFPYLVDEDQSVAKASWTTAARATAPPSMAGTCARHWTRYLSGGQSARDKSRASAAISSGCQATRLTTTDPWACRARPLLRLSG
jgi:peroxiredoxin